MKKYRSRVVEIEAVQWTGDQSVLPDDPRITYKDAHHLLITTDEGVMLCSIGEWLIRGTEGELYPCRDSVFQRKYDTNWVELNQEDGE